MASSALPSPPQGKLAVLSFTTGGTAEMYSKTGVRGDFRYFLWPLQVRPTLLPPQRGQVQRDLCRGLKAGPGIEPMLQQ